MTDHAQKALDRLRVPLTLGTRVRALVEIEVALSYFDDEGTTTHEGYGKVPAGALGRIVNVTHKAHPIGESWAIAWNDAVDGYDATSRLGPDQLDLIERVSS